MNYLKKFLIAGACIVLVSLYAADDGLEGLYWNVFSDQLTSYSHDLGELLADIKQTDFTQPNAHAIVIEKIHATRLKLKQIDFWLRYLNQPSYRKINGQLPVEWELEVFEKYERPRYRTGAGLSLAEIYLGEAEFDKDSLTGLIQTSIDTLEVYRNDSVSGFMTKPDHFFFANRLFLLNLAAIYASGFECPDTKRIIPELRLLLISAKKIYNTFNRSFPNHMISSEYLEFFEKTISFVEMQSDDVNDFNHFIFIRDYVNPLFEMNAKMILKYKVIPVNLIDITLNDNAVSIFSKSLFEGQISKGVYWRVEDKKLLSEIRYAGKLLFYDPLLSGNVKRSCASCHQPRQYFTDTTVSTNINFKQTKSLTRNTPSLINVVYNHFVMLDGRHTNLLLQAKDVTTHKEEMSSNIHEIITRILSCKEYEDIFTRLAGYTTQKKVNIDHLFSAVIYYYSTFSDYDSPFDDAMNKKGAVDSSAAKGFNLFMGKGRCGTCHYVPMFNGVKPPFIEAEFESIGVPDDTNFTKLSADVGRFGAFPEPMYEMKFLFRTPTTRNAAHTKPYMHNGSFHSLDAVMEFYNNGGGAGHGLIVPTQTLPADSLHLSEIEKKEIIAFINSTTEKIKFENPPFRLPASSDPELNRRIVGGEY